MFDQCSLTWCVLCYRLKCCLLGRSFWHSFCRYGLEISKRFIVRKFPSMEICEGSWARTKYSMSFSSMCMFDWFYISLYVGSPPQNFRSKSHRNLFLTSIMSVAFRPIITKATNLCLSHWNARTLVFTTQGGKNLTPPNLRTSGAEQILRSKGYTLTPGPATVSDSISQCGCKKAIDGWLINSMVEMRYVPLIKKRGYHCQLINPIPHRSVA